MFVMGNNFFCFTQVFLCKEFNLSKFDMLASRSYYDSCNGWVQTILRFFLNVQGAIDGTHISILKLQGGFVEDYYYHNTSNCNIVAQVVVNCNKKIIDIFIGFLGNVNESRVLHKFSLYKNAWFHGLFELGRGSQNGFFPYLLGDKEYPLISCIMIPYKNDGQHYVLEFLYNIRGKKAHSIVENAFGILKKTFWKLLVKSNLDVFFILEVFICYCLLHNLFWSQT